MCGGDDVYKPEFRQKVVNEAIGRGIKAVIRDELKAEKDDKREG